MARRLKKMIKLFRFNEEARSDLLSANGVAGGNFADVQLDPDEGGFVLRTEQPVPSLPRSFPTTGESTFQTLTFEPESVKAWTMIELVADQVSVDGVVATSTTILVGNSSGFQFWDGTQWRAPLAGEYNTVADVNANLSTFPFTERSIVFSIRLQSLTGVATPRVRGLKILWESDAFTLEDVIYRSLIRSMRTSLRPIAEYSVNSDGTTSIALSPVETPYQIRDVDSVYDEGADPDRLIDIASSYDEVSNTITLTSAPASGSPLMVRFAYEPVVAEHTGQDFVELAKVPAVTIEGLRSFETFEIPRGESVIDEGTRSGWELREGKQISLAFDVIATTDKSKDLTRLMTDLISFFDDGLLDLTQIGEKVALRTEEPFADRTGSPKQSGLRSGRIRVILDRVVFYTATAREITGVRSFQAGGDGNLNFTTGE